MEREEEIVRSILGGWGRAMNYGIMKPQAE
jgi:hypothetical protein